MNHDFSIADFLVQRLSEVLDVPAESIDRQATYERLGLDSMTLLGLAGEVEKEMGITVGPEVLADHPTIETIAAYIENVRGQGN